MSCPQHSLPHVVGYTHGPGHDVHSTIQPAPRSSLIASCTNSEFTFTEMWFALTMASGCLKWKPILRNHIIMNKTWGYQLLNPKLGMLPKPPSYWNLHFTVWNRHTLQTHILRNETFKQRHRTYCRQIRTDSNTLRDHMVHTNSYKVVISSVWNPSCTPQKRTCSTKVAQFPTLEMWA